MILFSDFDLTLFFRSEPEKTQRNLTAIRDWRAAGHQFCITTGRSYKSVTTELPEIKDLCDFYIVDGGSIITDPNGEIIHADYFSPQIVTDIIEASKTLPGAPAPLFYTPDSENTTFKTANITKLRLWFKDENNIAPSINKLSTFPVFLFKAVTSSHHPELKDCHGFIEIIPLNSGKAKAIQLIAQSEGFSMKDIITIGDGANDYDMVKDFDGYIIDGSELSQQHAHLKSTPSLADLISHLSSKS